MYAQHVLSRIPVLVMLCACAGCAHNEYQVVMSLDEEGLHRSVTAWQEHQDNGQTVIDPLPEAEFAALSGVYDADGIRHATGSITFEGVFPGTTPRDVGGAGNVTSWETSLGTLTMYSERLRGSDDLAGRWEARVAKIDRFCELLGGWAEENAIDAEAAADVKAFIDGPLHDDLKNLSMHCWTLATIAPLQSEREFREELITRLLQFGVEHGYVNSQEIPALLSLESSGSGEAALDAVIGMLDNRRGPAQPPLRELIPALRSIESLEASLRQYLDDTPEAAELRRTATDGGAVNVAEIPATLLAESMLVGSFFGGGDHVAVSFAAEQAPFMTNGEWDPDTQCVTWNRLVESRGSEPQHVLPTLLHAAWAVPDAEFQQAHFGRIVFSDELLASYIVWHEGLDETQAFEWDEFLSGLAVGDDLPQAFGRFRFSGEPTSNEEGGLLSDVPRRLLESALHPAD